MGRKQILVVGNNKTLYYLIQERMTTMEMDVCYAEVPPETLIQFKFREYCFVIIDVRIFEQTYLELIWQMRQVKSIPVLALSAPLSPENKLHLLQLGVNAFIEEPFNIDICIAQAYALLILRDDTKMYSVKGECEISPNTT